MANLASGSGGPEVPQVYPGTMLKVEEGQDYAVLCAADDESDGGQATTARPPNAPGAPHRADPSGTTSGLTPFRAAGGSGGSPTPPAGKGGLRYAAAQVRELGGWHQQHQQHQQHQPAETASEAEYEYEDDFADGVTTIAGNGSNSSSSSSSEGDDTETFSELSDPGGTEVVFVREGVAVWPGPGTERIVGRLSLVKQCHVLFMAWLPYSRGILQEDGTFRVLPEERVGPLPQPGPTRGGGSGSGRGGDGDGDGCGAGSAGSSCGGGVYKAKAAVGQGHAPAAGSDRTLYAVHPIPLSEVRALRRRSPPLGLGCPSLTVVLASGVTLPPLHFQRGGVKALISTLKQHAFLLRSADDPSTYLVNDTADPLSRSLSALQLADVLIGGPPPGASATFKPGEGVVAPAASPPAPPPPAAQAPVAAWATPTSGLGLAAAAGLSRGSGMRGGVGGSAEAGGGLGMGMGMGMGLQSAVSWCWADQPAAAAAAAKAEEAEATASAHAAVAASPAGLGGFEAVDRGSDKEDEGTEGAAVHSGGGRSSGMWAYGIVDAINRFVQSVRGTASGWIGALDDLDEEEDGELYDNYYAGAVPEYDSVRPAAAMLGDDPAAVRDVFDDARDRGGAGPERSGPVAAAAAAGGDAAACAAAAAPEVNTAVGDFELLDSGGCWGEAAAHQPGRRRVRPPPLSCDEWAAMFDAEGRLVGEAALRDRVFASGCAPELRREVWKHLLGMYPRGSTAAQRADTAKKWQSDYRTLRQQWQSLVPAQEARCGSWRCHRTAVDKDVRRTDRGHPFFAREGCVGLRALRNVLLTHVVYDRDLGYCQGMSDLAAPLLVVMRDEAEAFWAFAALMERLGANFHSDLGGMGRQLAALRGLVQLLDPPLHAYLERRDCLSYYFAFRWLLIHFKREFKFDEVLSLWEACWACRRTRHLHLYLVAAVLVQHRRVILTSDLDFDGMLRLSLSLAGRLELQPLLETAEALAGYAGEAGREVTAGLP